MAEQTHYVSSLASVAGANKHHLTIWNGIGSGVIIKVYGITATPAPTAAVTGLVIPLHAVRITSLPTGGSLITPNRAATSDPNLPAQIECRTGATVATVEPSAFGVGTVSGEETSAGVTSTLYNYEIDGTKPIELQEGQGLTVRQGALASAGAVHILATFTIV